MEQSNISVLSKISKNNVLSILIWVVVTAALLIFFLKIHPFIVFDTDDWTYSSGGRALFPTLNTYNPIKVLPETMMPFLGNIGAYVIYPIKNDYLDSLSISYGTAAAIAIFTLTIIIYKFYKKILKLSEMESTSLAILFLLVGFTIYKSSNEMMYFYYSQNLNCFYNYDFPGIINAITVLLLSFNIFVQKDEDKNRSSYRRIGCIVLLVYLCIFSNLYSSIILTSFVSCYALAIVANDIKNHERFSQMIYHIKWSIVIDVIWLVSMLFEVNGGRAKGGSNSGLEIVKALKTFVLSLREYSIAWIVITAAVIICGIIITYREQNVLYKKIYFICIGSLALTFAYILLLSAKVDIYYMMYPQYIWGILFYTQLLAGISAAKIVKSRSCCKIIIPFILFLLTCTINSNIYKYKESNVHGYKYDVAKAVGDNIIEQIKEAVDRGDNEVAVYVPNYERDDNWPLAFWGESLIGNGLYKHRIICRPISTKFERTDDKNRELQLP